MILWYAAGSVWAVWNVFQSGGIDVRAVAIGALMPLIVDVAFGAQRYGHTLLAPVLCLVIVMLGTAGRGRRLLRRHVIGVPIGWLSGIALSGAFEHAHTFWWPALGTKFEDAALWPSWPWAVGLEVLGLLAARWCWVRFGLRERARRDAMWRTGRVQVVG